jgi:hypothetical protein
MMNSREIIAQYNGCTHAFTFKEDKRYKLFIGDEDWRGFFEKSFNTYKEAREYAIFTFPSLKFYRANH